MFGMNYFKHFCIVVSILGAFLLDGMEKEEKPARMESEEKPARYISRLRTIEMVLLNGDRSNFELLLEFCLQDDERIRQVFFDALLLVSKRYIYALEKNIQEMSSIKVKGLDKSVLQASDGSVFKFPDSYLPCLLYPCLFSIVPAIEIKNVTCFCSFLQKFKEVASSDTEKLQVEKEIEKLLVLISRYKNFFLHDELVSILGQAASLQKIMPRAKVLGAREVEGEDDMIPLLNTLKDRLKSRTEVNISPSNIGPATGAWIQIGSLVRAADIGDYDEVISGFSTVGYLGKALLVLIVQRYTYFLQQCMSQCIDESYDESPIVFPKELAPFSVCPGLFSRPSTQLAWISSFLLFLRKLLIQEVFGELTEIEKGKLVEEVKKIVLILESNRDRFHTNVLEELLEFKKYLEAVYQTHSVHDQEPPNQPFLPMPSSQNRMASSEPFPGRQW